MRIQIAVKATIRLHAGQEAALRRNEGASRFAYNWCVARFAAQPAERKENPSAKMLLTSFDYINAFNKWKNSAEAGYSEENGVGLPWRAEVSAHVMEEAAADCGKAVQAFFKNVRERRVKKTKRRVGPPQFKSRLTTKPSFRLRNSNGKRFTVTKKGVKLPVFGYLRLREGTSRLRSLLRAGRGIEAGRILFATLSYADGHWRLSFNLEADARAVTTRLRAHTREQDKRDYVGCDVGIRTLACLANQDGSFIQHSLAPVEVDGMHKTLAGHQRKLALKRDASYRRAKERKSKKRVIGRSEVRAKRRLQRRFAKQRNARLASLHVLTTDTTARCRTIGIEDLAISNMVKNHCLARAVLQQAWGELRRQLDYKASWTGAKLVVANRFFPSSKRCSPCHETKSSLCLSQRNFTCGGCNFVADRDENAAINLAQIAQQNKDASPEDRGKGKMPELDQQGVVVSTPRGSSPSTPIWGARSRKGITPRRPRESSKERVDIVNAP